MKKYGKQDDNAMISKAFLVDQEFTGPSLIEALFSSRYRNATYTCVILAILTQLSGF